ncbi:MAG: helical backbone metal receptor [Dysgonamonadaceae bacterium]|nr:helical backbone metal receptor [Dysgonamonadaceae bacterium]MDD3727991.1 helical backbone metal receptor [Dysgonamonadaceae bacterium]MDD4246959.1 helical backbone metal receptor [Dysgonamonadaceae bacterium]MDD4605802.1 helical backbone metal receptor [Dysgonamonadaceae bacterium]
MNKKTIFSLLFLLFIPMMFAQSYKRIISLAPSLTQSLYYLDTQDKLVGRTSYCVAAEKENVPVVATAVKLNMEKAIAMKPDLVLVLGLTDAQDIETLRKFGIKVEVFDSPKNFEEICDQFIHLGNLVGKRKEAKQIVADSKAKISEIQKQRMGKPSPKIFFQVGSNPLFTVTPNTFMDDYITLIGGKNISAELTKGIIGREFVVAKNPDYIFICTMGVTSDQETKVWKNYPSMNAVKNNRLFTIDADIACQPTPITFVETMEVMNETMGGEAVEN